MSRHVGKDFLVKRFFNKYQQFVDLDYLKRDKSGYLAKLDSAYKMTSGIDYTKNILICYHKDYSREMFLSGFARMDRYYSFLLVGVEEIRNIYFGYRPTIYTDAEESHVNSAVGIREDVLCLVMNLNETYNKLTEDIVLSTIYTRSGGHIDSKKRKVTWIYFKGTELNLIGKYPKIRNSFINPDHINFSYHSFSQEQGLDFHDIQETDGHEVTDIYKE